MPTTAIKYEKFFPEKVYYCTCLKNAIDEIYKNEVRCYSEMILAVSECFQGDSHLYFLRVQGKSNCLLLCQVHVIITLLSEAKFDCTSSKEKDLIFDSLTKRYCKSCVRHYCEKLCSIYQFQFFSF